MTKVGTFNGSGVKKLIIILIMGMFLVSLVSASDPIFKAGQEFDLKRPCFNNGTYCSDSATCNITIIYDDSSIMVNNQLMTNQQSFHNYTITSTLAKKLGCHSAIMSCVDSGVSGGDTFDICITGDGKPPSNFPVQYSVIALGFLLISLGLIKERFRIFKHMGSIMIMIMGVLTLYPGYSFINWSTLMGKGLGFILIALGFYFLIEDSFSRDAQEEKYQSQNKEVESEKI